MPINYAIWQSSRSFQNTCRPHVVLATACVLLSWAVALLMVTHVLDNFKFKAREGLYSLPPLLLIVWSLQAACCSTFSISRAISLHSHDSHLRIAKVHPHASGKKCNGSRSFSIAIICRAQHAFRVKYHLHRSAGRRATAWLLSCCMRHAFSKVSLALKGTHNLIFPVRPKEKIPCLVRSL